MTDNNKGRLRKLALSNRDALSPEQRRQAAESISQRLLSHPALESAEVIMCYRSFRSEVDTGEIVENLYARGRKVCFPLCKKGGEMDAYRPFDENSWVKGMMGIAEPLPEKSELIKPEDIDLIICPMVAFDEERRRMGYGGGYYDRYLPRCVKALKLGIAFEAQKLQRIETDEYDVPMDCIITEEKIY